MTNFTLPPQTSIGRIEITIGDLDHSLNFYTRVIGLELLTQNNGSATLGTEQKPLLTLLENPSAQKTKGTTGLYHFAILVPDRIGLAQSLARILHTETPVQGFADHGVSEAIYLPDPDGNGIEIYRDRPRKQWPIKNGELQMVTDPLDLEGLLAELEGNNQEQTTLPRDTAIGHMHLHVRDIPEGVHFYRDILGFDLKQHYGNSAAFLAAGDYHHHIGINTWAGIGAPPQPEGSIGLNVFNVILPTEEDLVKLENHLQKMGIETMDDGDDISVRDPSGNRILFTIDR